MRRKVQACVHSLKTAGNPKELDFGHQMDEVVIVSHLNDNDVVAEYKGAYYKAIFNVFTGSYFVDDIYGFIENVG